MEQDFEGQHLADKVVTRVMFLSSVVAFAVGYHFQKFCYSVYIMLACMVFLFLVSSIDK